MCPPHTLTHSRTHYMRFYALEMLPLLFRYNIQIPNISVQLLRSYPYYPLCVCVAHAQSFCISLYWKQTFTNCHTCFQTFSGKVTQKWARVCSLFLSTCDNPLRFVCTTFYFLCCSYSLFKLIQFSSCCVDIDFHTTFPIN